MFMCRICAVKLYPEEEQAIEGGVYFKLQRKKDKIL